jgi:hypothetical protein
VIMVGRSSVLALTLPPAYRLRRITGYIPRLVLANGALECGRTLDSISLVGHVSDTSGLVKTNMSRVSSSAGGCNSVGSVGRFRHPSTYLDSLGNSNLP